MIPIPYWPQGDDQMCRLGKNHWRVPRLIELAKALPVHRVPLHAINTYNTYEKLTLREMVMHMKAVEAADLSYPIILDEDGEIMDGRHRVMKAILTGRKTILMVRFESNPYPDRHEDGDS